MSNRLVAGLAVVATAAALTGCGGGGGASKATGSAGAVSGDSIDIKSFQYTPATLKAKVGQKITVTNQDSSVHTLTASDKSFDSKDLAKGQSYTLTPSKAGTFDYICSIHQYMKGTLIVSG